ncbi:Acetyl-hydrolase-like protein [Cladobotryum mycophilum]|uniref:Acetyl-hydrolase-like protein n=1 Tax=Cladobotryum mycophilum TaxID=491253 RepID=A0ABR0SIS1_9HYPO
MIPLSILRRIGKRDHIADVRTSRRFSGADPAVCEKVSRPDFRGYWVCRGSINGAQKLPSQSHVTLLFMHGGGYIGGGPLALLVLLMRIAELAVEQNLLINIFTLEYSLAPEVKFPTQIEEATAAYKYLIDEEKIDPNSIMVLGESAGGHLALSLAFNLHQQGLPRPGKVGLLYPWVNLSNSGATFETNRYKDMLVKEDLDRCVDWLLGKDGRQRFAPYLNFASSPPQEGLRWSEVLPSTWVTIGGNDVFLSDVCSFVDEARKDGVAVDLHVEPGRTHAWLTFFDAIAGKQYLQLASADDANSMLAGSETIAKVVCAHAQECAAQKS